VQSVAGKHDDVLVRDIMTPIRDVKAVDVTAIERTTVAAVARLFQDTALSHIPVMETTEKSERRLRGLLSAAKVKRLLSKT